MSRRLNVLLSVPLAVLASVGASHSQASVPLGGAAPFAVLGGAAVTNTGPTALNGDLGVGPGASISGFPPGIVNGRTHTADATAAQAQLDLTAAYDDAARRAVTATVPTQLGGTTLPPGVYDSNSGAFSVAGTLTLDARRNGNAVFILKAPTTLGASAFSQIKLIGSAQACNVFWQVGGPATLGAGTAFRGNVLAAADVTAGSGATVDGRLLSRAGTVSLENDSIYASQCDKRRPKVKVANLPSRCTRASFRARFKVSDQLGVRTDVLLDGRRMKRSRKSLFTARIGSSALAPGPHRIQAVSRDDAGNKRVTSSRFHRCARPGVRSATG